MMNQLVELSYHPVTLRLVALMAAEITNAEATTHDREHKTINQPSDIIDFSSYQVALSNELEYRHTANSPKNRMPSVILPHQY